MKDENAFNGQVEAPESERMRDSELYENAPGEGTNHAVGTIQRFSRPIVSFFLKSK